jgi:hypothetical protein
MLGKLRCVVGWHSWERRVNREVSGADAVYFACRRCGNEKKGYGPPTPNQGKGIAAGG